MCTSFIHRGQDTIIAMNFDNNGMKYAIDTKNPDWFVVVVDSNGKGLYKRPSKKVTHTTKLITDILNETIQADNLGEYLSNTEVVNTPDWSCHNMICDSNANVWIIEPGRGNLYNSVEDSDFFAMTNFSLWDYLNDNTAYDCERYKTVTNKLQSINELDVELAIALTVILMSG